ncbi:hypothetical protein DNU06_09655 [Putridiphycobacter roseus]|uniref:Gliding motility protein RemB n=1 Tax=Putridiphycobacter roseus TaxID=2219161 RepID=A0A2W1NCB8_9FLAO|nr:hypothetical protein [Putridiphycobacter roseus]PZE17005.1 hypothetical protein DNU06_09655 [Putridiphycobacter roseus]
MPKLLVFFFLFLSITGFNQKIGVQDLNYRNYFSTSTFYQANVKHTSVKPYLTSNNTDTSLTVTKIQYRNKYFSIQPIANLNIGTENFDHLYTTLGAGVKLELKGRKWYLQSHILPYFQQGSYLSDSLQKYAAIDIGTGRSIGNSIFLNSNIIGVFQPNSHFTFLGGYGKNSFGEGYRSLLLSDNAAANPFVKMELDFWTIKYVSLMQVWKDYSQTPFKKENDIIKLSAMHYLSWNISKEFNFSVFETVVWQGKDSLTIRYLEPNYLNPFVLYRPVEYAQGSADNVLIGTNLSFKPNTYTTWYTQLLLDEFYLKEIRAANQWWANKFAVQIGAKTSRFFIDNLYAQAEFNLARPFTYSHKSSAQSYGHANASVTHPVGANFMELVAILSYAKAGQRLTLKTNYIAYGTDSSSISYGQNIFNSYANRDGNYDQKIMQGEKFNILNTTLLYELPLKWIQNTYLTSSINLRLATNRNNLQSRSSFEIGIKTRIWNKYQDY